MAGEELGVAVDEHRASAIARPLPAVHMAASAEPGTALSARSVRLREKAYEKQGARPGPELDGVALESNHVRC